MGKNPGRLATLAMVLGMAAIATVISGCVGPETKTASFTISFDLNFNGAEEAPANLVVEEGKLAAEPEAPQRAGFVFSGWYRERQCVNAWSFASDKVAAAMTLYAGWTAKAYAINYSLDGGTQAAANPTSYTIESEDIILEGATRENYAFAGWYASSDFSGSAVSGVAIAKGSTGNKAFYARWKINNYTVKFDSRGGSAVGDIVIDHGEKITAPTAPTKTGYSFGGWFKDEACSAAWGFSEDIVTKATTLYARWVSNSAGISIETAAPKPLSIAGGGAVLSLNASWTLSSVMTGDSYLWTIDGRDTGYKNSLCIWGEDIGPGHHKVTLYITKDGFLYAGSVDFDVVRAAN